MPNVFLTISMITREALRVLENSLTFTKQITRQYSSEFGISGAKIGTVLNVRKPPRYQGRLGQTLILEDMVETSVPVTLDTQFGVDISPSSQDMALSIDDFSKRFLTPAIATIANKLDYDGLQLTKQIYASVGTPGVTPADLLTYLKAGVKLKDASVPLDGQLTVVITPLMEATLVDALKGLFQQSNLIAEQYAKGMMGRAAGFKFYMDQNCASLTAGPGGLAGANLLVDGPNQTGGTLLVKGFTAAVGPRLNKGDTFTIAGVFGTNVQNHQSTGALQQFTVLANVASDVAGKAAMPISPAIVATGAGQTVTALAADSAIITGGSGVAGTVSPTGVAFHPDAFTLACADLPLPESGVVQAARMSDKQLGLSIRMIRAYDINTDRFPCRLDILYGWAVLRPELACRIAG
jgi:hypothetical protein